jgi:hypothetical protein
MMEVEPKKKFLPEGSLWTPTPTAAVNKLLATDNKQAARVLMALSLHLGQGLVAVFPSYPRIASIACVSVNNLRHCLNVLEKFGYIRIHKSRNGKKTQNHYEILEKAWLASENPKSKWSSKKSANSKQWICHTCWNDVPESEAKLISKRDWNGKLENYLVHPPCTIRGSARLEEATEFKRWEQAEWRKHHQPPSQSL